MITTIEVDETDVYDSLPEFDWKKYQKGFYGILNNAYNQGCNCGTKVLGDMSEITSDFDGGSYEEFLQFYYRQYDGVERKRRAMKRMAENLISRVRAVGGEMPKEDAIKWSKRYINHMLVKSYIGFMDEERAIELVADGIGEVCFVADSDEESSGIDGYIGDRSVQVKPDSYEDIDINSFEADLLVTYEYDDGTFTVCCLDT